MATTSKALSLKTLKITLNKIYHSNLSFFFNKNL
jgi:hypothetical protein